MIKIRLFTIDRYKNEEKWLNGMSRKGWKFVSLSHGVIYRFEKCTPGQYQFALSYRPEGKDYPETEGDAIFNYNNWIYFCRPARQGEYTVYSDKNGILSLAQSVASRPLYNVAILGLAALYLLHKDSLALTVTALILLAIMLYWLYKRYAMQTFIKNLKSEIE